MFVEDVLAGTVRSASSVLFAAQGEVIAERSGIVNLGVEGCMLSGALAAFAITAETDLMPLGILGGAVAGALLALLHAFLVIAGRANQLASGLAVYFLGLGATAALGYRYVSHPIAALDAVRVPLLADLPVVGPALFRQDPLTYAALALGPLLWLFLYRTRWGLILLATGERGDVAFAYGHSPARVRYLAVTVGGALAGVGGAQLVLAYTRIWVENVTVGRGFVAVALVIFATWDPLRATAGAFVFGGAVSLQLQLQARGVHVTSFALDAAPYVLTLAVLVLSSRGRALQRAPEGLAAVFGRARG